MERLRVRVYNVHFGDAILVSVPDRTASGRPKTRHILIDVGNVLSGEGGQDALFGPVMENVLDVLDGRMLDLYVMTHEHMDHVQGLLYASEKLGVDLRVRHAWLTASSEVGYYEKHPDAKERRLQALVAYEAIESCLTAAPERENSLIRALMMNNNPRKTGDCVDYLRKLARKTTYVYRGCDLDRSHTFHDARFHILAPERDTSAYYGRFQPMALGVSRGAAAGEQSENTKLIPLSGVDAGAFYNLIGIRQRGWADNLLAIDRAANNTSVVFTLEWRGWRLLFTGDAEHRSWKEMNRQGVFAPVHFLKVSHHCSHTGTPEPELLDKVLPLAVPDGRPLRAAISTFHDTYNNVPDEMTRAELGRRCTLHTTEGQPDGEFIDIEFPA